MHPLDNVIWQALTTRDAPFAEAHGNARRFLQQVTGLGAIEKYSSQGYADLAQLLGEKGAVGIFLDEPYEEQTGLEKIAGAPLLQMIHEDSSVLKDSTMKFEVLGTPDSLEMQQLTALTKPGPFGSRTHELGNYIGIRVEGKLVAMAGERLKVPGHTEISAVCTHPDHLGKGYAGALMTELIRQIRRRDEIPFLHSRADNARAIGLYKKLGFRERKFGHYAVVRRSAS